MEGEGEEDYFAPLGISQPDFNFMIRRRNVAALTKQLIERGRVTLPGTLTVPRNTAKLVKVEDDVANIPEPLVADVEDVARRSSSFYCCGIGEDSPRFATFFDKPCSRSMISENQSPTFVPVVSRESSRIASLPNSSPPVTSSTATSVSSYNPGTAAPKAVYCPLSLYLTIHKTQRMPSSKLQALISTFPATSWRSASVDNVCSGTAAPKPKYLSLQGDPRYCKTLGMPDARPHSLPAVASAIDKVRDSNRAPDQQESHERARRPASQATTEPELDIPAAIAALMQQYEQQTQQLELQPSVDRLVELGRLRRAIEMLDFGFDDGIMLASDLTTLEPVPSLPGSQERSPTENDKQDIIETRKFFRRRLARTVQRQIEFLRGEMRVGDALKIEHWYKEVVELVGWRDEDEASMSWSWLENDGFF